MQALLDVVFPALGSLPLRLVRTAALFPLSFFPTLF